MVHGTRIAGLRARTEVRVPLFQPPLRLLSHSDVAVCTARPTNEPQGRRQTILHGVHDSRIATSAQAGCVRVMDMVTSVRKEEMSNTSLRIGLVDPPLLSAPGRCRLALMSARYIVPRTEYSTSADTVACCGHTVAPIILHPYLPRSFTYSALKACPLLLRNTVLLNAEPRPSRGCRRH